MRFTLQTVAALAMATLSAPSFATSSAPKLRDAIHPQLAFEQNVGQADRAAEYVVRGAGHAIELSPEFTRIHLKREPGSKSPSARLTTELVGANASASGQASGLFSSYSNYIPSGDPATWRTHVPQYERVTFDEVYPGVDLAYYGRDRELEYDFIVEPGADPRQIKLRVRGAEHASLDAAGNLVLKVPGGQVVQKAPIAYQGTGADQKPVQARFKLDRATQEVSFQLGAYDARQTLVIDPVLSYATYFGGTGTEETHDIAIDSSGGPVIVGYTTGGVTTTSGAAQGSRGDDPDLGGSDVFVTKFSSNGASLQWSTYLGGVGLDEGRAVAFDASNNVVVAGTTDGGFPVANAAQGTFGGSVDAFVAKLSANGSSLLWSTYLGGAGTEQVAGVFVDGAGAVVVAGNVDMGFPTKSGYLMTAPGGGDGFVAKLAGAGGSVTWATYLGGPNYDYIEGVVAGGANNIVLAGSTDGGFPVQSAGQATYGGGVSDAFVAKIASAGTSLIWSTYLGGAKRDEATDVTIDKDGNFVVVGFTNGSFPMVSAVQATYGGGTSDMFVTRLSNDGQTRQFSSYLGGTLVDEASSVSTDASGNIMVAGFSTGSFPLKSPVQATFGGGGADGVVTKITVSGGFTKEWATYLGGTGYDYFTSVGSYSPGTKGYIYLTGSSNGGFPTSLALQSNNAGEYDAILVRLEEDLLQPTIDLSVTPASIVVGATATVAWSTTNATSCTASGAWTGTKSTSGNQAVTPTTDGTYTYTLTCSNGNGSVSTSATLVVKPPPPPPTLDITVSPASVNINTNSTLSWSSSNTTSCTASGAWSGAQSLSGATTVKQTTEGSYTYSLSCAGDGGSITKSATLTVQKILPKVTIASSPASITTGQSSNLSWSATDATSCTASGAWTGTKGTSGTLAVTPSTTGTFTYTLTCTGPGGSGSGSTTVTVTNPTPTLNLSASPTTVTLGSATTLSWATTNVTSCTASGGWTGTKAINGSQAVTPPATGSVTYTLSCTGAGGTVNKSVTVTVVQPTPTVTIAVSPTSIKQGASAAINWSSTNATSCTASGSWTGAKATTGSLTVTPTAVGTYTYNLSCTNTQGTGTGTATLTVTEPDPVPTVSISVSPTSITRGTTANITWASTNTTNCTASGAWSGAKALSGTTSVSPTPAGTYTYTLTCTGSGGDVSASATLTVVTPPPTLTFGASPGTILVGQSSTLTWTTTDATGCTASNAWTGSKGTNGSQTVTPANAGSYTYALTCTGDGGTVTRNVTVVVKYPPPTLTFAASPTTLTQGSSSTLTWSSTDTNACTASNSWTGTKAVSGSEAVTPASSGSISYTLTCDGKDGTTVSKTVVLTVNPPAPKPTVTISVAPASVVKGSAATITWSSTDATDCTATNAWTGAKGLSGSESTAPPNSGTYIYTLTCNGVGGQGTGSATLTVTDPPAPVVTLAASPTSVALGSSSTLTWTSTNSTSCTASGGWSGSKTLNGNEAVTPASAGTTVYTISCTGAGGTGTASATVTVNPPPALTFSISPAQILVGNSATLTWASSDATSCTSSNAWTGARATSGSLTVSPAAGNYTYTLACTGPGGSVSRDVTLKVTFPAPTVSISVSPSSIKQGQSSTLTWASTDTTACTASGSWTGAQTLSGSQSLTPSTTGSYVYTLSCTGKDGSTVTNSATLTVAPPDPAPTVTISVSPTSVAINAPATLTWNSTNATSCTASGAWSGTLATSGSQSTSKASAGTYTYSISCTGAGGTATSSTTLTVTPPAPTLTLSATPTSLAQGASSTLSWSSTNATSCTASGSWTGSKAVNGSEAVTPPSTAGNYTYTLTCTGAGGTTAQSVTLTVNPPPTLTFSAAPTSVVQGSSSTLTWTSTDATSCTASGSWTGSKAVNGSQAVTPATAGTYTYTLACTGAGGTVTRSATLTVTTPPAPTVTFSANPTTVTLGGNTTLTWSTTYATSCTASNAWTGAKAVSGSEVQTPTAKGTYTYVLSCTGSGGTTNATAVVQVVAPPTLTFTASTTTVTVNNPVGLTWSSTDTTSCTASGGWSGAKTVSGTESVTPTATGTVTYTLACTGPGGTISRNVVVTVNPQPTLTISASPTSYILGNSSTLTWSSTNMTSCSASGDWTGTKSLSGSEVTTATTTGTKTYTLTCTGAYGTLTASATVTVQPKPPTLTIGVSPTSIYPNGSATVTWASTETTGCTASGSWTGAKALSSSEAVAPGAVGTYTYTLTCTGAGGSISRSATLTVIPYPVPTLNFTASPTSINTLQQSVMTWSSANATACTASGAWTGAKTLSGTQNVGANLVQPTRVYTLTCTGLGGSVTKSVTITSTLL